jgi:hypothetical protein
MKPRLLLAFLAGAATVAAGPLPHFFVQNYTMHMALLDAYPMDHPIWMARVGDRELKVYASHHDHNPETDCEK